MQRTSSPTAGIKPIIHQTAKYSATNELRKPAERVTGRRPSRGTDGNLGTPRICARAVRLLSSANVNSLLRTTECGAAGLGGRAALRGSVPSYSGGAKWVWELDVWKPYAMTPKPQPTPSTRPNSSSMCSTSRSHLTPGLKPVFAGFRRCRVVAARTVFRCPANVAEHGRNYGWFG
jgi:hypothetical protein